MRRSDDALFYASSTLLLVTGVSLALLKDYLFLFVLGFSLPLFLLVIHLEVLPVLALPLVGAFEGFRRSSTREPRSADVDEFTAVVPVKEDAAVLERCVDSITEHSAAEVLVVYESDSLDETPEVARDLASRERVEAVENPPGRAGSKAGALNFALERTETDLVAVFDADHETTREDVDRALARFEEDRDLTYVSGRTVKREEDLLGRIGYGESLLFHQIPSYVMDRLLGFHLLTTTNCFFRRDAVRSAGGFDQSVLTEDMELGVRLFLEGEKTLFDPSVVSIESSARNVRDWWGQKKRWIRGSLEVSRRAAARPLLEKPGPKGLAHSALLTTIPFMYPVTVVLSGYLLITLFTGGKFALVPLLIPGLLVAYLARSDSKRGLSQGPTPAHLLSPFFLMLASFVGLKAMCEALVGRDAYWYRVSR